jgi:hypothetical protein
MSQIDVTIVVDVETVLGAYPRSHDPQRPEEVFGGHIYLIASRAEALIGDGSHLLVLEAFPGDEIRWQTLSATLASEYTVALYRVQSILGGECIGQPQLNVSTVRCFYCGPSDALEFFPQDIRVPHWSADLNRAGLVIYSFAFAVLDSAGVARGYYAWVGTIAIRTSLLSTAGDSL